MIQSTKKTKEMTDKQCPKEVTHSLMCYVYKVNVPMMGLRLKRPHTEADLGFEDSEVFGKIKRT